MANWNTTALGVAKWQFKEWSLSWENRAKLLELTKKNIAEAGWDREAWLAATREQLAVTEAPQIAEEAVEPVAPIEATPPPEITPVEPIAPEIVEPPVEEITPVKEVKIEPTEKEKIEVAKLEEDRIRTKSTETLNKFNEMLELWVSTTELAQFAVKQPWLKTELNTALKRHFWNKSNLDYVQQFETATDAELTDAIDNKDIVIWSRQYNLLPEETRRRVDRLNTLSSSTKETDFTKDNENVLSLTSITDELSQFFSFDLRSRIEEAKNNPELKQTRNQLEWLQNNISDVDASLESMEDDLKKEFPNLPKSALNALLARRSKDLIRSKNSLVWQYNSKLATYSDMKQDINTEIEISKFEDSQNKQLFQTALWLYQTRRNELRQDEQLRLQEESKIRSEQRQVAAQKELTLFNQKIKDEKVSGKWQTLPDGLYFLRDDWTADKVYSWEEIGITKKWNTSVKEYRNDDGSITTVFTDLDTQETTVWTKDAFGNIIYPGWTTTQWTDLRFLANQYPWQAWAKNNNSAWLTWWAVSDQLKWEWAEAWINFSQWTSRPSEEWWNYVNFPDIQDWLAAHAITLWRKKSSIQNWLAQWVGWPSRASNLSYAQDIYEESWIKSPITTPLNELNDWELYSLMSAQIKRESPWLYSKMKRDNWLWETAFAIPIKSKDTDTATSWGLLSIELPAKASDGRRKSLAFGNRMAVSTEKLLELEKKFADNWYGWQSFQTYAPNFFKSNDQQLLETYKENFITASLRQESWASIAPEEFKREEKKYFALPWDSKTTIIAKQEARELAIQSMLIQVWVDNKWASVIDYYTPNDITEIWTKKSVANPNYVDNFLDSTSFNLPTNDSSLNLIFETGAWGGQFTPMSWGFRF